MTDPLDTTIERLFGERVRANVEDAKLLWGALSNVKWWNREAFGRHAVWLTFREAGCFVADLRNKGENYIDFYCSAPWGVVPEWLSGPLAELGWTYKVTP